MKNQKKVKAPFTAPLLQELVQRAKSDSKIQHASLSQKPDEEPSALYQDAGAGYNLTFVFPQE
jgi:hypothetical protein